MHILLHCQKRKMELAGIMGPSYERETQCGGSAGDFYKSSQSAR